ncbi:VOC family protein [Nonomuraea jiangxiensis]|uniref:VOC domain-containing protein n=1 Tax=Nonomuraea jiangxiensis TaxID=633440 RepID=A0A1G9UVI1_9ACTN|nr:VOC family protein [Nonomuraea jiangxiensis]SDM63850.1 hypothetical protein SAMN05421869_15020 [Nonomuraea jiangxiensis]
MDVLYPRLLVRDFPSAVAFYQGVLRELLGVEPVKVLPEHGYANWDVDGQAALVLYGREAITQVTGSPDPGAAGDTAMLVMKVDDVDEAAGCLVRHGAVEVAPPQDRPEWAPGLRTAHLRDPESNLIELQSY